MAEIASSLGTSSQSSTDSTLDMLDGDGLHLSPSVKEAMDRILPRSASHLLQHRLPFDGVKPRSGRLSFEARENGDEGNALNHKNHSSLGGEESKTSGLKKRISRADLEVITAKDKGVASCERNSRRLSLDKTNDCTPKPHSDSDDVSRPFAVVREKKKENRKKKKKQAEVASDEHINSVGESEDDVISFKEKQSEKSLSNPDLPLSDIETVPKSSNILTNGGGYQNSTDNDSLPSSLTGDGSKHDLKDFDRQQNNSISDDMSNNSFSSAKENVEHNRKIECQKLPRVKMPYYNVTKHKNKIKKTFPPTFVVIEQISALLSHANEKYLNLADAFKEGKGVSSTVLPLSVRLKYLSSSCANGKISCRKNKKVENPVEVEPKHQAVLDSIHIPDSEDDFEEVKRGRSLRKRDRTICYVEPTEADLFMEYGRKRSRSKAKDPDFDVEEETIKKRKLNPQGQETATAPQDESNNVLDDIKKLDGSKSVGAGSHSYARAKPPPNSGPKEVVVFPKPTKDPSNKSSKSKPIEIRAAPVTGTSSSASTVQSTLTSQPGPGLISTFPPFFTSMSTSTGVLGATNALRAAAIPSSVAPGSVRPQFCMVRMDGKDMLLPVVPPTAGAQCATLFLPGGKRLVVPSNHQLSQQLSQGTRMMGPLPMSAMNMPLITRPSEIMLTGTSSLTSSASNQTFRIRSVPNTLLSQATRTITPVTVYPPSSLPSQTTSAPVTSHPVAMAAPNSTTVVRNIRVPSSSLRAAVPNQAGGVRAVRIFVPGCQATGVPGRFATLGSVATNTSALTHLSASSDLLPQRKQTNDQLTPEQRAEKRRKLEKKYPLPPGVVIKTEPLDTPTQSTSTYSRSLLPGNIQVVSASRRPGMQNIRFINPASVASMGSSGIANFIVRAAPGGGRQTILIPSSLGMLTTSATIRPSGTAVTPSSLSATVVTSANPLSGGTISVLPALTTALSNCSTINTTSSGDAACSDVSISIANDPESQSSANKMAKLKTEVETMRKLLAAQEAMGLRGDRIEKLKEILKKKEGALEDIAQPDDEPNSTSENDVVRNTRGRTLRSKTGQSETEPIEID